MNFHIGTLRYSIEQDDDEFVIRKNGCGIHRANTLNDARRHIHTHAKNQLRSQLAAAQARLEQCEDTLTELTDDWFYLSRFEVPNP